MKSLPPSGAHMTLNTVAGNLTSPPARACHDVMLWLNATASKFIFHNLGRKSSEAHGAVVFFYGSFNSSYCLTARHVSAGGNQWQTGIKVERIGTLVFCQPIQGRVLKTEVWSSFTLVLLIIMLYWKEINRGLVGYCSGVFTQSKEPGKPSSSIFNKI